MSARRSSLVVVLAGVSCAEAWTLSPAARSTVVSVATSATLQMNEAAAKAAWLAKLDAPQWGPPKTVEATQALVQCSDGSIVPTTPTAAPQKDDAAKAAWLANQESPSWGRPAVVGPSAVAAAAPTVDAAKAAWLANQESPSWGRPAARNDDTIDRVLEADRTALALGGGATVGSASTIGSVVEAQNALAQMAALEVAALQSEAEKLRAELLEAEANLQMMRAGVVVRAATAASPAAAAPLRQYH